jgi:universal stress protein A
MYRRILVPVEHSTADATILTHVTALARLIGARILLLHVADGWAARNFDRLQLRESEEMVDDRRYLERVAEELTATGLSVETRLALGDPASEIIKTAEREQVDLIAMATHGHRGLADVVHGATADHVRHAVSMPVLLLKATKRAHDAPLTVR